MKLSLIASAFAAACLVAVSAMPVAAATHKGKTVVVHKHHKTHKVVTGGYG